MFDFRLEMFDFRLEMFDFRLEVSLAEYVYLYVTAYHYKYTSSHYSSQ